MQQPMSPMGQSMSTPVKNKKFNTSQMIMGILLIAIALLSVLMLVFLMLGGDKGIESAVKKDQYQAVFLNSQDGQVYFGKLTAFNQEYYKLEDIYYVRVEQKIQPEGSNSSSSSQQNISLAKLGNELHGPEDVMFIAKDKVLFWENLKEEGQVVKAIREYQKNPSASSSSNSTTGTNTGSSSTSTTGTGTNSTNNATNSSNSTTTTTP